MDRNEMLKQLDLMKPKLMAAISMLLVSTLLLTNVTYAWFVLSAAPEVADITTTAGSNGVLDIALQSTSGNGRAEITGAVGDSVSHTGDVLVSNKTWGNIVDLSTGYGLENITLFPARLNLLTTGVSTSSYLQFPSYGSDGRIVGMNGTNAVSYDGAGYVDSLNYGVNVHSAGDEMSVGEVETSIQNYLRSKVRDEAVENVYRERQELREDMVTLVENNSVGILFLLNSASNFSAESGIPLTESDKQTVETLIMGLDVIVDNTLDSLRWALLANAISDDYYSEKNGTMEDLGEIYKNFMKYPLTSSDTDPISIQSIAEERGYEKLIDAVEALVNMDSRVETAKEIISSKKDSDYAIAALQIVAINQTYLMCGTEDSPETAIDGWEKTMMLFKFDENNQPIANEEGAYPIEDDLYLIGTGDPTLDSLFPAMATILGDFTAKVIVYMDDDGSYTEFPKDSTSEFIIKYDLTMRVTSATYSTSNGETAMDAINRYNNDDDDDPDSDDTNGNDGALYVAYEAAANAPASGKIPVVITTRSSVSAYGYSVDFALRASETGNIMLQKESTTRVSEGGVDADGKVIESVQGGGSTMTFKLGADLMNEAEKVRGLLDCVNVVFMDTDSGSIYAVAKASNIYINLEDVTADLQLYSATVKDSELVIGDEIKNNVLLDKNVVEPDEEIYLTALVYLDGDQVSNAYTAASAGISLLGSINLQFASDSNLESMSYDDYYTAPSEDADNNG